MVHYDWYHIVTYLHALYIYILNTDNLWHLLDWQEHTDKFMRHHWPTPRSVPLVSHTFVYALCTFPIMLAFSSPSPLTFRSHSHLFSLLPVHVHHWAICTTTAFQAFSLSNSRSVPLDPCCKEEKKDERGIHIFMYLMYVFGGYSGCVSVW